MPKKSFIIVSIILMAVGFAVVTTNLIINGNIIVGNNEDFVVIFTGAKLNGTKKNNLISSDKKTITFSTKTLITLEDVEELEVEVTNTSRNYDANIKISYEPISNEYININLPSNIVVKAGKTETSKITIRLNKLSTTEQYIDIKFKLTATPEERTTLGDEYIAPFSKAGVLMKRTGNDKFWKYDTSITKVVFEDKLTEYQVSDDLKGDASSNGDGSVQYYLVPNKNDSTKYTLYLQSETGVKANPDSRDLFWYFSELISIEGLEYFDTSNVTNMGFMFYHCLHLTTLDLSNFDTSNVLDMRYMFYCCNLMTLDLSNFDTSNVTDMDSMFDNCNNLNELYLGRIDINNNSSTSNMFLSVSDAITFHIKDNATKIWLLEVNPSFSNNNFLLEV